MKARWLPLVTESGRKPPCWNGGKDCPRRTPDCHAGCRDYKDFAAKMAELKAAERQGDAVDAYIIEEIHKAQRRRR